MYAWGGRTMRRPSQSTPDAMSKLRQEAGRIAREKTGYRGYDFKTGGGFTKIHTRSQQEYNLAFAHALRDLQAKERANYQLQSATS
jgi:hypothetical protein